MRRISARADVADSGASTRTLRPAPRQRSAQSGFDVRGKTTKSGFARSSRSRSGLKTSQSRLAGWVAASGHQRVAATIRSAAPKSTSVRVAPGL